MGRPYRPFRGQAREEAGTRFQHSLLQTPRDNFLNTCYVYHS